MRTVPAVALLAAAFLLPACGSKASEQEAAAVETMDTMEELNKVLETVKDEASAKAAVPKLEPIAAKMQELKKRMEAMPKPSAEADAALKTKYEARQKELMTAMMQHMMRIGTDEKLNAIVGPTLEKMGG